VNKRLFVIAAVSLLAACKPCIYNDAAGECMTEQAYFQMVAPNPAHNAEVSKRNYCSVHANEEPCIRAENGTH
jgi:hypothetical protein